MSDFTVVDFLTWARTKPADEEYDFTDAYECAVAQFGIATGRNDLVGLCSFDFEEKCPGLLNAVNPGAANLTFGGLVARLEAMIPVSDTWTKADAYIEQVSA